MKYVQPIGAAVNAPYVDANPGAGQEGSAVPAAAIEHTQREIVAAIVAAGLVPASGDLGQLASAIAKLASKYGVGGTAAAVPGGNINDNTIPCGMYYVYATDTGTKPLGDDGYGHLIISREGPGGVTVRQLYQDNSSTNTWVRVFMPGSGWSSWEKIAVTNNPVFTGTASFEKLAWGSKVSRAGSGGGSLSLEKPNTGSALGADVSIDVFVNAARIFEGGGSARGIYVDLTECAPGAGSKAWHSGNDGSGSGLDADLLDGQHGSYYTPLSAFSGLIGTNGHQPWPSGLIMQWCTVGDGASTSADTAISANFPITFPTECFGVLAILVRDTALSNTWGVYAKANNLSTFTVVMDGVSPGATAKTVFCLAFGK